jgi:hypothetical protein
MNYSLICKTFVAFILCLICNVPQAAKSNIKSPQGYIGIYSDMHFNSESGDVRGVELFITYTRDGYYVLFQNDETSSHAPILVKAYIGLDRIEFELPDGPGYTGRFKGVIDATGIKGQFENGQSNWQGSRLFVLKRKPSYWQQK